MTTVTGNYICFCLRECFVNILFREYSMNAWHAAFRCLQEEDTSQTAPKSEALLSSHYSCCMKPSTLIPSTFRDSTVPPPWDRSCSDPAQYHFKIYQVPGYLYTQPRTRIQKSKWNFAGFQPKKRWGCVTDRHRYEDKDRKQQVPENNRCLTNSPKSFLLMIIHQPKENIYLPESQSWYI